MNADDSTIAPAASRPDVDYYGAQYTNYAVDLYAQIRRETYGEDAGQTGWQTAAEQDRTLAWLALEPAARVLDVACGNGGLSVRLARLTGAALVGIDLNEQSIANARARAQSEGLEGRLRFERRDATEPLPWAQGSFDAVICIDSVNHFPDRAQILREWARLLKPGGKLLFTDPITVTGPLTNAEIAARSSIGFFLFVPPGVDEASIAGAGLELQRREDLTESMAQVAARFRTARADRSGALRQIEGEGNFAGQQEFLRVAELLARERRLGRFAFLAVKPAAARLA
jgi:2-polyprenyl-3-methyl-5-hydroxy-6-metoxy-1,4-benzoquinol methylase